MSIRWLFILIAILAQSLSAQNVNLMRHRFRVSKSNFVDTIPLTIDRYNQILIPASIDGRRCFFKLDTGSGFGTVYQGHGIQPARTLGWVKSVDGAGHRTQVKAVVMPPFTIGSVEVSNYVMTEAPASVLSSNFGHEAVIGFALFAQGLTAKIDVGERRLILTDRPRLFDREAGERLKYHLEHYAPHIAISPRPGVRLNALFDTGSSDLFIVSKTDLDTHLELLQPAVTERVYGQIAIANHGLEPKDEVAFMHFDSLMLGNLKLSGIDSRTHQGATSLGRVLLQYGSMVVRPRGRQLIFQPYASQPLHFGNEPLAAVYYVPHDGHASIGLIRHSSPLYAAGLRQGDVILRINDRAVDFAEYLNYPWLADINYRLLVRDADGNERVVTIVKSPNP